MTEAKKLLGEPVGKPEVEVSITQETIKGGSEENRRLRGVGELLAGDLSEHVGSIGIHLYRVRRLDGGFDTEIRTQTCFDDIVTANEVKTALYTASVDVARKYGYQLTAAQTRTIKEKK